MKIAFVDCETNGLDPESHSVLSVAVILVEVAGAAGNGSAFRELARYERFYLPLEPLRPEAVAVNGLTEEVLLSKRGRASYPLHYIEDAQSLAKFVADADLFVGHNIGFDEGFLQIDMPSVFCTSDSNVALVEPVRFPRLSLVARHYDVPLSKQHDAMGDAETCMRIYMEMRDLGRITAPEVAVRTA